jgi:hypothetical protein
MPAGQPPDKFFARPTPGNPSPHVPAAHVAESSRMESQYYEDGCLVKVPSVFCEELYYKNPESTKQTAESILKFLSLQ